MIIVRLMGGLGNQMFQYAAARRLALRHGTDVAFDDSYFKQCPPGDTPRVYMLHRLSVVARFATATEVAEMGGAAKSLWKRVLVGMRRAAGLVRHPPQQFREPYARFCPEVLHLPDDVYLIGYWHAEQYFADVAETIRAELMVRTTLTGRNLESAQRISDCESVAVHFRRGDYVSSAKTMAFHGVFSPDYYQMALDALQSRVNRPRLFVFSDDPQWVRQHVKFSVPFEVVDHNPPGQEHEDLRLMSLCRHAIIANSSFSWWGAWLNSNPDKVVIAPRRWFADERMNSSDLIPPNWLRVE